MDVIDAAAMLARARQGDAEAFRSLVEQHSRRAFLLAFRITGSEPDAEDIVQESFLRAYRRLGCFQARANFGTWLHRIVANCAVDVLRARHSRTGRRSWTPLDESGGQTTDLPDPHRLAESGEVRRRVEAALAHLSPLERAAFTLRHAEGHSIAEISRTLGLGTNAAKHSVFRAVKKLRAALRPLRPTDGV
jgi:RNA polymerase sigma-70 factor (ECF subfamily)